MDQSIQNAVNYFKAQAVLRPAHRKVYTRMARDLWNYGNLLERASTRVYRATDEDSTDSFTMAALTLAELVE